MTLSLIRQGEKTILKVPSEVPSPNDDEDLKLGARNSPIDGFEGTDEEVRDRDVQINLLQCWHLL
jgi:hypothetical protein